MKGDRLVMTEIHLEDMHFNQSYVHIGDILTDQSLEESSQKKGFLHGEAVIEGSSNNLYFYAIKAEPVLPNETCKKQCVGDSPRFTSFASMLCKGCPVNRRMIERRTKSDLVVNNLRRNTNDRRQK